MTSLRTHVMATTHSKFSLTPVAQAMAATLLIAHAAQAQNQPETPATLPQVVVSERSPLPLADVAGLGELALARAPVSANLIDARQIEASGATRLADVLKFDASASDAYNAVGYWDAVTLRGYVLDNKFNYRREGLPINAETAIGLENKERVELLKGTSGLQAGTSAPGGLVQYVVKRPTDAPLRSLRLETNDHGGLLSSVDLGGRWGHNGEWGYRLNLADDRIHSAVAHANGHRQLAALALDWRLNPDTMLQAEAEYTRRVQASVPGLSLLGNALPAPDPKLNINSQPWSQPVVLQGLSGTLRLKQALNADWRWSAQVGTQRLTSQDRAAFPFGCSAADGSWYADRFCPNGDFDLYDFRSENEQRQSDAAQLQLQGRLDTGGVQHRLRVELLNSHTHDRFQNAAYNWVGTLKLTQLAALAPDSRLTDTNTQRRERSTELSWLDGIAWSDKFSTWLGLRRSHWLRDSVRTDGTRATATAQAVTTPWVALSYQLNPQHLLFASMGRGAESVVVPNKPSLYQNAGETLEAAVSRQAELGVKAQHHALGWQLTAFSIERPATNLNTCVATNATLCSGSYDGSAIHRGLEAAAQWRNGPWSLNGALTLLDARRVGSHYTPEVNGLHPSNVPSGIARLQADYRVVSVPGLSLQGHWSHEGPRAVLPDGSITLPAWNRLDAALHYDSNLGNGSARWLLGVDNLLDKRYFKEAPYQFAHVYLFPAAARKVRIGVLVNL